MTAKKVKGALPATASNPGSRRMELPAARATLAESCTTKLALFVIEFDA
jgi:hypothetical protein